MEQFTVKDFVMRDFRAAAIFEKYSIDFCCHGNIPLDKACQEKGIPLTQVETELGQLLQETRNTGESFDVIELDTLAEYIITTHHRYVKDAIPVLRTHTEKVAMVHGERHPELLSIRDTFALVAEEMTRHMQKEELMLFPYIKALAKAARTGTAAPKPNFGTIQNPIRMMEAEHLSAGDGTERIRNQSLSYLIPS
ncbi:MAG TPA: DUF542 domain-containing protein, partial [Terriglobia bacterium]|nr:DUF542 domain-containing protein [Terriglobia bacterium]